jgi:hypothetical protein
LALRKPKTASGTAFCLSMESIFKVLPQDQNPNDDSQDDSPPTSLPFHIQPFEETDLAEPNVSDVWAQTMHNAFDQSCRSIINCSAKRWACLTMMSRYHFLSRKMPTLVDCSRVHITCLYGIWKQLTKSSTPSLGKGASRSHSVSQALQHLQLLLCGRTANLALSST